MKKKRTITTNSQSKNLPADSKNGRSTKIQSGGAMSVEEILEKRPSVEPGVYKFQQPQTAEDVMDMIRKNNIQMIDFKFIDLPGTWQHTTHTVSHFNKDVFKSGAGFDGSSIRGFQEIHESDMLLMPDPTTAFIDPFAQVPTLSLTCDVFDPTTRTNYTRDPRNIAKKAEAYLKKTGIATTSYFGPELEFFVFDSARFDQNQNSGYYFLDSSEANWNSGKEDTENNPNTAYKIRNKEGYFPVAPHDTLMDLRTQMVLTMQRIGIQVEIHHHEVATGGQCEIDMRFSNLTRMADKVMMYKYVVKNVARKAGKVATFMPKPLFGDNGSGMHCHQSLWKDETPLFYDAKGWAMTSQLCRWYIGGLMKHGHALMAFCAPTTNSYKRLVPGYEAPVNLVMSQRNRSAACRIPMYWTSPGARRVEFRCPDPSANPYLAFAAMMMAGLDGIKNKIDPGQPVDKNIFELPASEAKKIKQVPSSLEQSLAALEDDHDFLTQGDVFTQDVIDTWIDYKRKKEIDPVRLRPHPWEFYQYFDI